MGRDGDLPAPVDDDAVVAAVAAALGPVPLRGKVPVPRVTRAREEGEGRHRYRGRQRLSLMAAAAASAAVIDIVVSMRMRAQGCTSAARTRRVRSKLRSPRAVRISLRAERSSRNNSGLHVHADGFPKRLVAT